MWQAQIKGYKAFLQIEQSLSNHSVESYLRDVRKLTAYLEEKEKDISVKDVTIDLLQDFVQFIAAKGLNAKSQARTISGVRSFFKYCVIAYIPCPILY